MVSLESKVPKDELFLWYTFFPAAPLDIISKFPEVRFVTRISFGDVAITFVISRYYVATVINRSIRINIVFSISLSAKTLMLQ